MTVSGDDDLNSQAPRRDAARSWPAPDSFERTGGSAWIDDPLIGKLVSFFEAKGLAVLKDEDRRERWYDDWLAYQATHRLYASLLSPKKYSAHGGQFDLLRLARFLEVFGYFSPAHGYSLQVTFLGLLAILAGGNDAMKQEAVSALEAGDVLAFGVSEQEHGSDLLGNEFTLKPGADGNWIASGSKYYIGNANCAALMPVLARKEPRPGSHSRRATPILFALRPKQPGCLHNLRKIATFGVRAGYVGAFDVKDLPVPQSDVIAEGRDAWEAIFASITLGKFLLGFGAIGICERAFGESAEHLHRRVLYGKPVSAMPHIRSITAQAYVRLTAMKLYAYRALDYVHGATEADRRYLFFNAVQKAKVSTEGVKVIAMLSECIGAKGFESDTYFEMALRDIQLIPGLESSMHVNLALTAQFLPQYLNGSASLPDPRSLIANENASGENPYLFQASTGNVNAVEFARPLRAYDAVSEVRNVRIFTRQIEAFRLFVKGRWPRQGSSGMRLAESTVSQPLGECLAIIAYGQLIAENASLQSIPAQIISAIFHLLVLDMNAAALSLTSRADLQSNDRFLIRRIVRLPRTATADWDFVADRIARSVRVPAANQR